MKLEELGWNEFFSEYFRGCAGENIFPARVIAADRDLWHVDSERGELSVGITGKLCHQAEAPEDFPAAGDWVVMESASEKSAPVISGVFPRRTCFSRKASGDRKRKTDGVFKQQVIAANMDWVFIVSGLDRDFNPRRIERYLTLIYESGADPVLVLNKSDICADPYVMSIEAEAAAPGVPVHLVSAVKGKGLHELEPYLGPGKTAVLVGSSGAGKSTLINALLGEQRQKVKPVSTKLGKGRHTTTRRELVFVPCGGMIMDNPGLRELQLAAGDSALSGAFDDIDRLSKNCRFADCSHEHEPGCTVLAALESGTLERDRYESYLKLKRELWYQKESRGKSARQIEKAKWERILKGSGMSLKHMTRVGKNKRDR
jgi:ribosome biogenesis GTPase